MVLIPKFYSLTAIGWKRRGDVGTKIEGMGPVIGPIGRIGRIKLTNHHDRDLVTPTHEDHPLSTRWGERVRVKGEGGVFSR
jgi:hypothetical protein